MSQSANITTAPVILLLEDSEVSVRMVQSIIGGMFSDGKFIVAYKVEEALEALKKNKVNLVLADLHIGKGNSYDVFAKYPREKRDFSMVVVTGDRGEETLATAFQWGADDVISKPFDPEFFEIKIRSLLAKRYVSPLAFFGRPEGLGQAKVEVPLRVVECGEFSVVVESEFLVGAGSQVRFAFPGIELPVRVGESERVAGSEYYRTKFTVLTDLLSLEEQAMWRAYLMHTEDQLTKNRELAVRRAA